MTLKYSDFYVLINIINNTSLKNKHQYSKLFLFYYFNFFYKFNLVSLNCLKNNTKLIDVGVQLLSYIYKFFSLYLEVSLLKQGRQKHFKLYNLIFLFNFFFKFLNWYYNFLSFSSNIIIVDDRLLKLGNHFVLGNSSTFLNIAGNNNKVFIVLDNKIFKNYSKLLYEFDLFVLNLSTIINCRYNKNSILQIFFAIRNLVLFIKFFNNI